MISPGKFPAGGRSQWNVTEPSKKKRTLNRQLDLAVRRSLLTSEKAGRNGDQGEGGGRKAKGWELGQWNILGQF